VGKLVKKGKTSLNVNKARDDGVLGCSGISWTICKQSESCSKQQIAPTATQLFADQIAFLMLNRAKALKARSKETVNCALIVQ